MVRERIRAQQAIAMSAVTLPVSTGMHGAVCMAPLYVQAVVQVKGNFAAPDRCGQIPGSIRIGPVRLKVHNFA